MEKDEIRVGMVVGYQYANYITGPDDRVEWGEVVDFDPAHSNRVLIQYYNINSDPISTYLEYLVPWLSDCDEP